MKSARYLYLTLAMLAGGLVMPAFADALPSVSPAAASSLSAHEEDKKAIRQQASDYAKAFASADAVALAAMWAADAVYTDAFGNVYRGRAAIKDSMSDFFKRYGKQSLDVVVESIDFPSDDTAIERGRTRLSVLQPLDDGARYTAFHVKKDGKWQMVDVTESFYRKPNSNAGISDLGWLIGSWNVTGPNGSLKLKYDWVADKSIIRCMSTTEAKDGSKSSSTQFIYWNPDKSRILSWQYDATGGFSDGWWEKIGKAWVSHSRSVEHDGCVAWADYIIRPQDSDNFSWQSTGRHLESTGLESGKRFPDTGIIKVIRDKG